MIYIRTPTDEELHGLKRMTRQEIGRAYPRAQKAPFSAQRHTVSEIARVFAVEYKAARKWLRRFDAEGPTGLSDEQRSGQPRKSTESVRRKLIEMIQQDPKQSGTGPPSGRWRCVR